MFKRPDPPRIDLPCGWPRQIRSAVLHVIALAQYVMAYTRRWATNSPIGHLLLKEENDGLRQEVAPLREEIRQRLQPHMHPLPIEGPHHVRLRLRGAHLPWKLHPRLREEVREERQPEIRRPQPAAWVNPALSNVLSKNAKRPPASLLRTGLTIAGAGLEPAASGLWARRAIRPHEAVRAIVG